MCFPDKYGLLFIQIRRFHVRENFLEDVSIYFKRIHCIPRSLSIYSLFMDIQNSTLGFRTSNYYGYPIIKRILDFQKSKRG